MILNFFSKKITEQEEEQIVLPPNALPDINTEDFENAIFESDASFQKTHPFSLDEKDRNNLDFIRHYGYVNLSVYMKNIEVFRVERNLLSDDRFVCIDYRWMNIKKILSDCAKKLIVSHKSFLKERDDDNIVSIVEEAGKYLNK